MGLPRIVPWAHCDELTELQNWFYPERMGSPKVINGIDSRSRAIQRVKCYQSRGSQYLPHVIDSTAQITSSILLDERSSTLGGDSFPTRLCYTMSLIRFVNGLLDPTQQSQYAIPLHTLAQKVGVPSLFVDLRHGGTHERELPSLEMLRCVSRQALTWLWDHYWNDDELDESEDETTSDVEEALIRDLRTQFKFGLKIKNLLIEYRWAWESGCVNLISSSNFMVEESRGSVGKKNSALSPNEQLDDYILKCQALWKRCNDKSVFIEELMENYEPTLLQIYLVKMKGFDQEFYSWVATSLKKQLNGDYGIMKRKFPSWRSLEKKLLLIFTDSLDLNLVLSKWGSWEQLFDKNVSFFTIWFCNSLKDKIEEHRSFHSNKRRKKKKQAETRHGIEGPLHERILKLNKLYNDSDKKLYDLPRSHPTPSTRDSGKTSLKTSAILDDLASLRERMKQPENGTQGQTAPLSIKLWSRPTGWEPKPFGTL